MPDKKEEFYREFNKNLDMSSKGDEEPIDRVYCNTEDIWSWITVNFVEKEEIEKIINCKIIEYKQDCLHSEYINGKFQAYVDMKESLSKLLTPEDGREK